MSKKKWLVGYEGVCEINPKHRFHSDTLTPCEVGTTGKKSASPSKVCCGRPIKYKKVFGQEGEFNVKE